MADEKKKASEGSGPAEGKDRNNNILSHTDGGAKDLAIEPNDCSFPVTPTKELNISQGVMDMLSNLIAQRAKIEEEIMQIAEVLKDPARQTGEALKTMAEMYDRQITTMIHPDRETANNIYHTLMLYVGDVIEQRPELEHASLFNHDLLLRLAEAARNAGEDIPKLLIEDDERRTYRTRAKAQKAESLASVQRRIASITLNGYEHSLSLYPSGSKGQAYLQPLRSADKLKFRGGKMYFENMSVVSAAELQNLATREGIEDIDLPLLKSFYTIILSKFEESGYTEIKDVITLRVPDLAEWMGYNPGINKQDTERIIAKAQSFHNIVGIMAENGKQGQSLYPVLNFEGYDNKTNEISFSSPYMNHIISIVYRFAVKKMKNGQIKVLNNGNPDRKPSHSYLIHSDIVKCKDKAAVENVSIIVTLIEQSGNHIPNIKASTLVERNPQLSHKLESSTNKTQTLKRVFTATWRLLITETDLKEKYNDIHLPSPDDPRNIPTLKNLDTLTFSFPHNGKKEKGTNQANHV